MALIVVPNAGQSLNQTRDPIRNNFGTINTAFAINHVEYGLAGDQGKHHRVTFPRQILGFNPGTAATEFNLFNAPFDATPNSAELWLKKGVSAPYPYTRSGGIQGVGAFGFTYLPSGSIIKWGSQTTAGGVANVNTNVGGPAGSPVLTSIQSIQLTNIGGVFSMFRVTAQNTFNFTVASSVNAAQFWWMVIGK